MYDYLIIGSGLFGSVFARQAADAGKKVFVIDKRPNIAGNVYTEKVEASISTNTVPIFSIQTTQRYGIM